LAILGQEQENKKFKLADLIQRYQNYFENHKNGLALKMYSKDHCLQSNKIL
jgi:hypothetical protein